MSMNPDHNQLVTLILDRSVNPEQIIDKVLTLWKSECGDVAMLLPVLADIQARATISSYHGISPRTERSDQVNTDTVRTGKILSALSNKDFFSFSIKILDESVLTHKEGEEDSYGDFRNFAMLDTRGTVHDGWKNLTVEGDIEEDEIVLLESEQFVSPFRWKDIMKEKFLLTKLCIERLEAQQKFVGAEKKRLIAAGVQEPPKPVREYTYYPADTESFPTFVCQVKQPFPYVNEFAGATEETTEELVRLKKLYNKFKSVWIPQLRYYIRVVEFAFHKDGMESLDMNWTENRVGATTWKESIAERFDEGNVLIRYRIGSKKGRVPSSS